MTDAFEMHVALEAPYRAIVPEVAARYAELWGGSSVDGAALAAAVKSVLDRIAVDARPGAHVDLAFRPDATGVHVDVSFGSHRETVSVAIHASKS